MSPSAYPLVIDYNGEIVKIVPVADELSPLDTLTQSLVGDEIRVCQFQPVTADGVAIDSVILLGVRIEGSVVFFDKAVLSVVR